MLTIASAAATSFAAGHAPSFMASTAASQRAAAPLLSTDLDRTFKRAEFWIDKEATSLDIVNVLGRWDSCDDWKERKFFVQEGTFSNRQETELQAQTLKRYEMAQRLNCVERVAHYQNVPLLPFKNAKLAAAVGKTVEEMNALPRPTKYACNVVYDALAQSKSGLIPPDVIMQRRAGIIGEDGSLDLSALSYGINRARVTVITSWFLFGKGQIIGGLVLLKILYDTTDIASRIPIPKEIQDVIIIGAAIFAACFAAGAQASDDTEITDLLEAQELPGMGAAQAPAEKEAATTPSA